ncbi:MAG TPA: zeta toxin family protein [Bryobacteraceae bacterium]|nr:zeta toxin family protein [Bryobacteraceae bacterium]
MSYLRVRLRVADPDCGCRANGSGKSTLTGTLDFEGREHLLDPDAIARRLDPANPSRMAIAAGRELLRRMQEYIEEGLSFGIETTLASKKTLNWIRDAKVHGFSVKLIYICLDTPENSIVRVQERTSRGGHDVGDQDVRRRYHRSLANLPEAIRIADQTVIYDNSERKRRKMLELQDGSIVWRAVDEPHWIAELSAALLH